MEILLSKVYVQQACSLPVCEIHHQKNIHTTEVLAHMKGLCSSQMLPHCSAPDPRGHCHFSLFLRKLKKKKKKKALGSCILIVKVSQKNNESARKTQAFNSWSLKRLVRRKAWVPGDEGESITSTAEGQMHQIPCVVLFYASWPNRCMCDQRHR